MGELRTKIRLRKDTEANWLLYNPVLLDGEVAIVEVVNGIKFKVGDGKSAFADLDYTTQDIEINENTFVFEDDLTTNYSLGKYAGTLTNPATINAQNKTLKEVWNDIFTKVESGTISSNPSASLTCSNAGSYEVGTKKSTSYSAALSAGAYSFGPETGVIAKTYAVTFNGETKTTNSGDFGDYIVEQGNKTMNLTITYDAAPNKANKSDGSEDTEGVQIAAGSKTDSKTFSGYRCMFYGTKEDKSDLNSDKIRALSSAKIATGSKDVSIPVDALRVVYAVPATYKINSVKDKNGLGAEIFSSFTSTQIDVEGANGYTAISYNVYYLDYANPNDKANTYTFTVVTA